MKYLTFAFAICIISFLVFLSSAFAQIRMVPHLGISETKGVYCEINEVRLFALTAEDCEKAGGMVTHTVNTEVKEVEPGNPNESPEIQRKKDKEPAPAE